MGKLDGTTIIVTGAASGIGAAITLRCLQEGASVVGCDRDLGGLNTLQADVQNEKLSTFPVDVSSYDEVEDVFSRIVRDFPATTRLVNNAGIYYAQSILDYTVEQIDAVLSVNIKGAIYWSQLFGRYLAGHDSSAAIVNISSVSGHEGSSDAIYGLSKAALLGLTKSCALNFAPNIRVNAVAPGLVETPMLKAVPQWRVKQYREHELLTHPIRPEDVADTVAFLLSDESRHYTGAIFDLNNGCYLR